MFLTREQMQHHANYAFRFEAQEDLALLLIEAQQLDAVDFVLIGVVPNVGNNRDNRLPEFHCYIHSDLTLQGLRELMRAVPHGDVMIQTLDFADEYTGRRNFDVPV